jgi:hypothetical protein
MVIVTFLHVGFWYLWYSKQAFAEAYYMRSQYYTDFLQEDLEVDLHGADGVSVPCG